MELILEFMIFHTTNGRIASDIKPIVKPIRSLEMSKIVDDVWDVNYALKLSHKQLFDVISAANYLQVDSLLNLLCARVATLVKSMILRVNVHKSDKSHDEIRKTFSPNEQPAQIQ